MIGGLKSEKHRAQWGSTLRTYCKAIWSKDISKVTTEDVFNCLDPIWDEKTETARRLRGRIEHVLSAAKVDGHRDGLNPARWPDNLKPLFQNRTSKKAKKHHAALPFEQVPAFMVDLRKLRSTSARALEFVALTAVRTGEALLAKWGEVDFDARTWTIPAHRMKGHRTEDHVVPLSDAALAVLKSIGPGDADKFIFAAHGRPLSDQAMLECLRGVRPGYTVHGFRSSFRDWAGDATNYPRDLAELALAHVIANKAEAAYRRRTGLERRRPMMDDWARYLAS